MTTKKERAAYALDCATSFREQYTLGCELYFVQTMRSVSGMTRGYRVLIAETGHDGRPTIRDATYLIGRIVGMWNERAKEIRVGGCGFSGEHHVTDALRRALGGDYGTPEGIRYTR